MFLIFIYLVALIIRPQDWIGSPFYMFPIMYSLLPIALIWGAIRKVHQNKRNKLLIFL